MKELYFTYPIEDIKREVDYRSSRIAVEASKRKKDVELEDMLRLSAGDETTFDELMDEAVHETYDWVRAFGKIFRDGVSISKSNGQKKYTYPAPVLLAFSGPEEYLRFSNCAFISGYQSNYQNGSLTVSFPLHYVVFPGRPFVAGYTVKVTYSAYDSIRSAVLPIEREYSELHVFADPSATTVVKGVQTVTVNFTPDLHNIIAGKSDYTFGRVFDVQVCGVYVNDTTQGSMLQEGDIVEYTDETLAPKCFKVTVPVSDHMFDPKRHKEIVYTSSDSIIFHLAGKDWWDENRRDSVYRYLKESIVNRILARWYEIQAPEYMERFEDDFESNGRKAMMAMNANVEPVRRNPNWL